MWHTAVCNANFINQCVIERCKDERLNEVLHRERERSRTRDTVAVTNGSVAVADKGVVVAE